MTSQVIKARWSVQSAVTYVTAKQVETATFDGFWKKLWFTVLLMTAYWQYRKTKGISSYKFQADNQRRMQAVTSKRLEGFIVKDHSKPHRTKLRSDAVPTISFCALMKIKVRLRQKSKVGCLQGYFLLHRSWARVNAYGLGQVRLDKRSGAFSMRSRIEVSLGCMSGRPTP